LVQILELSLRAPLVTDKNINQHKVVKFEEKCSLMHERLLDDIFGYEARLNRSEWEQNVVDKADYIFDSQKIRQFFE
jgi:hypothetical protein